MSQDGFNPSYLAGIEKFNQLLRVILRQNRAGQVAGLEQAEIWLKQRVIGPILAGRRNDN
jgi:hypothetical protein